MVIDERRNTKPHQRIEIAVRGPALMRVVRKRFRETDISSLPEPHNIQQRFLREDRLKYQLIPRGLIKLFGFCGGFTTFSAFAVENVNLFQERFSGSALAYIVVSVTGGLLAVWGGFAFSRAVL